MIKNFDELIEIVKQQPKMKLAVAAAEDDEVILSVNEAVKIGIIDAVLVGEREKIKNICDTLKIDIDQFEIIDAKIN